MAPVRPTCSPLSAGSTRAARTPAGFSGSATSSRCATCTNSSNNTAPQVYRNHAALDATDATPGGTRPYGNATRTAVLVIRAM